MSCGQRYHLVSTKIKTKEDEDKIQKICEDYTEHTKAKGPFGCDSYDPWFCFVGLECWVCLPDTETVHICTADFKCVWDTEANNGNGLCKRGDPKLGGDGTPIVTVDYGYYTDDCY